MLQHVDKRKGLTRMYLFPIEGPRIHVGRNFEQNAAIRLGVVDYPSSNSYREHVGCTGTEIKTQKERVPCALLSGESRCRARSRDTRRPWGWVVSFPPLHLEEVGDKSIVSSKTSSLLSAVDRKPKNAGRIICRT